VVRKDIPPPSPYSVAPVFCPLSPACQKSEPIDESKAAGLTTADFPQITADIFKPMDGGIDRCPEEIMGRNTWNCWSGGNQHFWNRAAQDIQPVLLRF
jgi:hypothetical protein